MPALGLNATHGAESWASYVLQHLAAESVLLRSGARAIPVAGRKAHIPRVLSDGTASWVGELVEIPSSAPQGDELVLEPKKVANTVTLSRESIADSPADELDTVGNALTGAVATALDVKAFSADVATADAPAGIRSLALPAQPGGVTLDNITRAAGTIANAGGLANAVYLAAADRTTLSLLKDTAGRPLLVEALAAAGFTLDNLHTVASLPAGTAIVAEAGQIVVGVRRDAEVEFSEHAKFTADGVVAKVVARVDVDVNDVDGLVVVTSP